MHMSDALLSPAVGGAFFAASGALLGISAKRAGRELDEKTVPLMGMLGAFVFAAQMINFSIPGTGSSGHLVGGVLLTALLGPWAAYLTICSVVVVQALLFADGGILALGTNMWNLGAYPCFVGYLILRAVPGGDGSGWRRGFAITLAAVGSLELAALSVAAQTWASGRSDLPLGQFAALMALIHLPIGLGEGLVTALALDLARRGRPGRSLFSGSDAWAALSWRGWLVGLGVATALSAGVLAWFASSRPDGLEWSLFKAGGQEAPAAASGPVHQAARRLQERTALAPDYDFRPAAPSEAGLAETGAAGPASWPQPSVGTSSSGLIGALVTLLSVGALGAVAVKLRGPRPADK